MEGVGDWKQKEENHINVAITSSLVEKKPNEQQSNILGNKVPLLRLDGLGHLAHANEQTPTETEESPALYLFTSS